MLFIGYNSIILHRGIFMKKMRYYSLLFFVMAFLFSSLFFSCEENKLSSLSNNDKLEEGVDGGGDEGSSLSLAVAPNASLLIDKLVVSQSTTAGTIKLVLTQLDIFTGGKNKEGKAITSNDQLVYTVYGLQKDTAPSNSEVVSSGKKVELPSLTGNKYTISGLDKLGLSTDDESQVNIEEDKQYHFVVEVAIKNDLTKKTYSRVSSITVGSEATSPSDVINIKKVIITDNSISISWTAPSLTSDHKKRDGSNLTTLDVSYKVYRVKKDGSNVRAIDTIIAIDKNPITVQKNTHNATSISDLIADTTYEIVVQAVNSTDTTRVSTGLRVEATTLHEPRLLFKKRGSSNAITSFTTKAQGEYGKTTIVPIVSEVTPDSIVSGGSFSISPDNLTRVTGLSFNTDDGTISGVARYVVNRTTYTIKFTASDGREVENSIDITIGYKYAPANKPELIQAITAELQAQAQGSDTYNYRADLNIIDTSAVRRMDGLFFNDGVGYDESKFNGNVSKWDTSEVTHMGGMFGGVAAFNQDISNWNTSNVTHMGAMFRNASAFNQDISNWDVRRVKNISRIFYEATAFDKDVSSWKLCSLDTVIAPNLDFMNSGIANNKNKQPTSKKGTDACAISNTTLIPPEVSIIRYNMITQGLEITWQSPSITSEHVDADGDQLTQDQIEYKIYLAKMSGFGQLLHESDIIAAATPVSLAANTRRHVFTNVEDNAYYAVLIQTVNSTDTTKFSVGERNDFKIPNIVINPSLALRNLPQYVVGEKVNETITIVTSDPNVAPSATTTLSKPVIQKIKKETGLTVSFDRNTNTVSISGVVNKSNIWDNSINSYLYATMEFSVKAFNIARNAELQIQTGLKKPPSGKKNDYYRPTTKKELSNLINITKDLSIIDTSAVTNMSHLFARKKNFNVDISNWRTDNVTDMSYMFFHASSFNIDIGRWNTSKVTNMDRMLSEAHSFNQDISDWDVNNVENFDDMFRSTHGRNIFNQNLSTWIVKKKHIDKRLWANAIDIGPEIGEYPTWEIAKNRYFRLVFYGSRMEHRPNQYPTVK